MNIEQFRFSRDNLGYLVYSQKQGIAIDAGAVEQILAFAEKKNIQIKYVTNTHSHHDHTPGNAALLEKTDAQFIDCRQIKSDQTIHIDHEILEVWHTPGHTDDCVTFKADDFLITGDTLFNGTVGNCFSGDLDAFFKSLTRLAALPENTKVYGGHDYVMESMEYAKTVEKDNPYIEEYIKNYNPEFIVSTLADELKVNLFLRFNAPKMIKRIQKQSMPADTEFARFNSLMEIF